MPTDDASAVVAADVEVPGPRSRGSSDTVSPTVITLPSRASRSVAGEIDCVASFEPLSGDRPRAVHRHRRDDHGRVLPQPGVGQRDVVEQRGARRRAGRCDARPRRRWCASRSATPRPTPECQGRQCASGCSRTTPRRESSAEVFSRAVSRRWASGGSSARRLDLVSHCRVRSAQPEPRHRPAVGRVCARAARRTARRCFGLASHASGRAATQRWLRIVNGMMHR